MDYAGNITTKDDTDDTLGAGVQPGEEVAMQKIKFYLGDERHVRLLIHATNGEPFAIREARYELKCAGQVEASGACMIDEHVIDARIAPEKRANYRLYFIYQVADETLMERVEVAVE